MRDLACFAEVKVRAQGMLAPEVYQAIYEAARTRGDGDILEIGCYRGASTVALAMGLADSKRRGLVYTIDVFGKTEEEARINSASHAAILEHYGLSKYCVTFRGFTTAVARDVKAKGFSLVFMDADGMIHRDFGLFFRQISPGAKIILDDCVRAVTGRKLLTKLWRRSTVRVREHLATLNSYDRLHCLGKHYLTHMLATAMQAHGYFSIDRTLNSTAFGQWRPGGPRTYTMDDNAEAIIEAEIVERFVDIAQTMRRLASDGVIAPATAT